MPAPLFQQRHFVWLAAWARHELPMAERICLRNALAKTSVKFDAVKFDKATGADEYLAGIAAIQRSHGNGTPSPRGKVR